MSRSSYEKLITSLFPAAFICDESSAIIAFGNSIKRQFPKISIGDAIEQYFEINLNEIYNNASEELSTYVKLVERNGHHILKGPYVEIDGLLIYAVRHRPMIDNAQLGGLSMHDFAPDDDFASFALQSYIQRNMVEECTTTAQHFDEQRRQNLELLNTIKQLSSFMAHDLSNIVSIIKLNSELMKITNDRQGRIDKYASVIISAAKRADDVTGALMALAKDRSVCDERTNIGQFIGKNRALFEATVGERIYISYKICDPEAVLNINSNSLYNIFTNILLNSRQAMAGEGSIAVSVSLVDIDKNSPVEFGADCGARCVLIEISDSGPGFGDVQAVDVFSACFSEREGGRGLGLASVKNAVTAVGGRCFARSPEAGGAQIDLYVPLACPAQDLTSAVSTDRIAHRSTAPNPTVLVAEDEPDALEAISELIRSWGFEVSSAKNGEAALKLLKSMSYDILLSDFRMAKISGVQLANEALIAQPNIKIILMSGYEPSDLNLPSNCSFLKKPINCHQLKASLNEAKKICPGSGFNSK